MPPTAPKKDLHSINALPCAYFQLLYSSYSPTPALSETLPHSPPPTIPSPVSISAPQSPYKSLRQHKSSSPSTPLWPQSTPLPTPPPRWAVQEYSLRLE